MRYLIVALLLFTLPCHAMSPAFQAFMAGGCYLSQPTGLTVSQNFSGTFHYRNGSVTIEIWVVAVNATGGTTTAAYVSQLFGAINGTVDFVVNWNDVTSATKYYVYYQIDGGGVYKYATEPTSSALTLTTQTGATSATVPTANTATISCP
jgi:hypothetical protein